MPATYARFRKILGTFHKKCKGPTVMLQPYDIIINWPFLILTKFLLVLQKLSQEQCYSFLEYTLVLSIQFLDYTFILHTNWPVAVTLVLLIANWGGFSVIISYLLCCLYVCLLFYSFKVLKAKHSHVSCHHQACIVMNNF
jgi:hypothetical protein